MVTTIDKAGRKHTFTTRAEILLAEAKLKAKTAPAPVAPIADPVCTMETIWRHLDCIYTDTHDLPTRAARSIADARALLLSGRNESPGIVALLALLEDAEKDIRATGEHLDEIVNEFGEGELTA